jgi:hypothetical protein
MQRIWVNGLLGLVVLWLEQNASQAKIIIVKPGAAPGLLS